MPSLEALFRQVTDRRMGRREFLGRAAALGAAATAAEALFAGALAAAPPSRGGTLRQGLAGGSTSDGFDPATWTDSVNTNYGYQLFNTLVEIDHRKQATPELAESWEARPGAVEWIVNIRKGVEFHNGKTLDADDVLYSLNWHLRKDSKSAAKGQLSGIKEISKTGPLQLRFTLESANADLPYNLSEYHLVIVPDGFTDWARPVGTGGYILEAFEPGVKIVARRNPGYWKSGRAHFDSVETLVINDPTARTSALLSGQVDVINHLERKTIDLLSKSPGIGIKRSAGGQHYVLVIDVEKAPLKDNNLRLALKYAIDRQQILTTALRGYGRLGNDHPIPENDPFFNSELPQRAYDPDKARYYLRQAGLESLAVELHASIAAFPEAIDTATLYQASAARSGITVDIRRDPSDGYWDNVWMKVPFCMSFWSGRPTADGMFSLAYKSDASWNDSRWRRPDFDKLLLAARGELDHDRRKQLYWEMQAMVSADGGNVIPVFADFVDAASDKVQGFEPDPVFELSGARLAERGWFAT